MKTNEMRNVSQFVSFSSDPGAAKDAAKAKKEEPFITVADKFKYSPKDMNDKGRLPVIVTSNDPAALDKMKNFVSQFGLVKESLPLINGFSAEINPDKLGDFFKNVPESVNVFVDGKIQVPKPLASDKVKPKLDTAMPLLGMEKLWDKGYTGNGVGIAIIDTGIYPHEDIKWRIVAFNDMVSGQAEPYDDFGHGTHVAGLAAGSGRASCGKFTGSAPEADLISVKVLDGNGSGTFSDVIKGIQWATENKDRYNIRVMNLSLGGWARESYKEDPVAQAIEKAADAGIVPCIAAGNDGDYETVGTPATAANAVTVGAYDDKGTLDKADDDVAYFSSRGPSIDGLLKPEVLSPGVDITGPNAPGSVLDDPSIPHTPDGKYITISGTSMATPIVAGLVADLVQANPNAKPYQIKEALTSTAESLAGKDAKTQGAGLINPEKALEKVLWLSGKEKQLSKAS